MAISLSRRQLAQVGALAAGGWAVGVWLRRHRALGRRIDRPDLVRAILDDPHAPASGPADAPLRLAVFSDYRCPACRKAFPAMEDALEADGRVRVVYKDWPIFGVPSEYAARIALATAEQGIYPAVHRRLMTDGRTIDDGMLRDIVTAAGGDWTRATAWAVAHGAAIDAQLAANARQAAQLGLPGTPGYLANDMLVVGALDRHDFSRLFAQARQPQG